LKKVFYFITLPFREGNLGILLGGTIMIFICELLEYLGSAILGSYGGIPGLLIKICAIALCIDYIYQLTESMYSGEDNFPYWEIRSINFSELLENFIPILVGFIYAIILSFLHYLFFIIFKKFDFSIFYFFTHIKNFGLFFYFSLFFPAIFFISAIEKNNLGAYNPFIILKIIVNSMPYYIIFTIITFILLVFFINLNIPVKIIGSFIKWFIMLYLLLLYGMITGKIYRKLFNS